MIIQLYYDSRNIPTIRHLQKIHKSKETSLYLYYTLRLYFTRNIILFISEIYNII